MFTNFLLIFLPLLPMRFETVTSTFDRGSLPAVTIIWKDSYSLRAAAIAIGESGTGVSFGLTFVSELAVQIIKLLLVSACIPGSSRAVLKSAGRIRLEMNRIR